MAMIITPDKEEDKVGIFCKAHFNVVVFFDNSQKKKVRNGVMIITPDKEERKGGVCNEPQKVNEEM